MPTTATTKRHTLDDARHLVTTRVTRSDSAITRMVDTDPKLSKANNTHYKPSQVEDTPHIPSHADDTPHIPSQADNTQNKKRKHDNDGVQSTSRNYSIRVDHQDVPEFWLEISVAIIDGVPHINQTLGRVPRVCTGWDLTTRKNDKTRPGRIVSRFV